MKGRKEITTTKGRRRKRTKDEELTKEGGSRKRG